MWQSGAAINCALAGATVGNVIVLHCLTDAAGEGFSNTIVSGAEALDTGTTNLTVVATTQAVGNPTAATQGIRIGRATTTTPTIAVAGTATGDCYYRLYEFSGVASGTTLSDVLENSSAGATSNGTPGTSATISDTAVVTLGSDRLALNFIGVNDDNQADFDTEAFTGMTGGTWVSGGSYGTATGTDGAIGLQYATMASAGTIDGGTLTMVASDSWGVIGFALIPEVTYVPRHPAINHQNPGLLMENVKRNWNRLRSGLVVPDREIWTPPVVTA